MLRNEAAWLKRQLAALPASGLDPLLSLGSGGADFRDGKQPWIAEGIYAPLEQRGVHVVHHEFSPGPGVDVAGDLADPVFLDSLTALETQAVICCNVLEHLADRQPLLKAFGTLVAPGSVLVLTVPRGFPYHADPIDTMYRPSVAEVAADLPGFRLVTGDEVPCGTLWRYLRDAARRPDVCRRGTPQCRPPATRSPRSGATERTERRSLLHPPDVSHVCGLRAAARRLTRHPPRRERHRVAMRA